MPRKKEYKENEVLDKAMYSFWNSGYEGTTVRMLEKDMGINQFSIYSSFENKHKLFLNVLDRYKQHVKTSFLKTLIDSKGHVKDIRLFLLEFGMAVQNGKAVNGCLMVNTGMEMGTADPIIANRLIHYFKFIKESFSNVLEKAKARGELESTANCHSYAEFLLGSLQGLSLYARFRSQAEVKTYVQSIMSVLR